MKTGKIISLIVVVVVLIIGGFFFWRMRGVQTPEQPSTTPTSTPEVTMSTYASSTLGFSVTYPPSYTLNDAYAYDQFGPKKLIHGVKFTIPATMATGTNLSGFDTGVSVEELPHAKNCTADIFLPDNVKAQKITEGSVDYSVASSSGAGAGNFYEETVYALSGSSPCTAVRYFIHSTNIHNYPPGMVHEFDRVSLLSDFDAIRHSLVLSR